MEKTKYRVTGSRPVFQHPPGSVFEAELSPEQEERLIARGSIEKVRADAKVGDTNDEPKE